jgi:DNA ligase-1
MTERDMTLGRDWRPGDDLRGWLLSEKLDDIRSYWDGHQAWTRGGHVIDLPDFIRAELPVGYALDGGIWAGRGNLEIAKCAVQFNHWTKQCRFIAYDAPTALGTWPERMAEAATIYGDCVRFTVFKSARQLNSMLRKIQQAGGEGIVARHPRASGYAAGWTDNFLKIKTLVC